MQQRSQYTPVRAYVMRKEWYYPRFGPFAAHYDKEVRGYTNKEDALRDIEMLNVECTKCPTRTAKKTHYYLQEQMLTTRIDDKLLQELLAKHENRNSGT